MSDHFDDGKRTGYVEGWNDAAEVVKSLRTELDEAREALAFYASLDTWHTDEDLDGKTAVSWEDCDAHAFSEDDDERFSRDNFGGKRAREFFAKYQDA